MFIQIRDGITINLAFITVIHKDDKDKDYPKPYSIEFIIDQDRGWSVYFTTKKDRDKMFDEVMRKVSCIEWKSD
jgi:hypothetical protein